MWKEQSDSMQRRAWLLIVPIIVFGCTSSPNNSNHSPSGVTSIVPNISVEPTHFSTSPSPLPTVIVSQTQLVVNQQCIEIASEHQSIAGDILVFQKELGSPLTFVDAETGKAKIVPDIANTEVFSAYVSPNGKWIVYQLDPADRFKDHQFILANADGIQQNEMPFGAWGFSSIFWLNNMDLRVTQPDNSMSYIDNFALDPFLGYIIPLRADLPDIGGRGVDWNIDRSAIELGVSKGINIIYDPTLTRALYPKNDGSVSLYDLETNQEIMNLSTGGRGKLPKWSPSGAELALIRTATNSSLGEILDEFAIISRDGSTLRRLSFPSSFSKRVYIENYSWSPDGSRIALWLRTDNKEFTTAQNPLELAVLDVSKNQLTTYCISGTRTIEHEGYTDTVEINWSPDGTSLLIVRYKNDSHKSTDEVIVDLSKHRAFGVTENMLPIGWMVRNE